ncbi:MAG: tetratricopeptide repeat protein [Anaerolineae bacterium]|nr:tetratricopeptide repeat protein [Anaerolineae bacterium]
MIDGLLPAALIGRDDSLARFADLCQQIRDGRVGHFWVTGEAGCGKSAFLQTCTGQALEAGWEVLRGQCTEETRANPYGPFLDMLGLCFDKAGKLINDRSVYSIVDQISLDDVFEAIDDIPGVKFVAFGIKVGRTIFESRREQSTDVLLNRNFEFILQVIEQIERKRDKPILLVIDDLHLASPTTRSLIEYILTRSQETRLLVMAAWEAQTASQASELSRKLSSSLSQSGASTHLAPLSEADMRHLISQHTSGPLPESLVATFIKLSRGLPLLLLDSLRLVDGENGQEFAQASWEPDTTHSALQMLLDRQLAHMTGSQYALLECAARFGQSVPLDVIAAAPMCAYLGMSERQLLSEIVDLADLGTVLTWEDDRAVCFPSSLVRQYVRERTSRPLVRRDHLRIAQAWRASGIEILPAQLATHYLAGGDPERALEFALQSAGELARIAAYPEAVESYKLALDALTQLPDRHERIEMEYDILRAMSLSAEQAGDWDEALSRLQQALVLRDQDAGRQADIHASIGWLRFQRGEVQAALASLNHSAELYDALDDVRGSAHVDYYLGMLYSQQKEWQRAAACFEQYVAISDRSGFDEGRASATIELGNLHRLQYRWTQAEHCLQQGIELAQSENDYAVLAQGYHYLGLCYAWQNKPESVDMLNRALEIVDTRTKQPAQASRIQNTLAETLVRQNRWQEAEAAFHASARIKERLGDKTGLAMTYGGLGRMYSRQWRFEPAAEHLQKDIDLLAQEFEANIAWIQQWTNMIGEIRRLQKKVDLAEKRFADALVLAERIPDADVRQRSLGFVHLFQANLALDRGQIDLAANECELARDLLSGTWAEGELYRTTARLARLSGDLARARDDLDRAVAKEEQGEDIDRAQTALEQAHYYRAVGDSAQMNTCLERVIALAQRLQNVELEERARAMTKDV